MTFAPKHACFDFVAGEASPGVWTHISFMKVFLFMEGFIAPHDRHDFLEFSVDSPNFSHFFLVCTMVARRTPGHPVAPHRCVRSALPNVPVTSAPPQRAQPSPAEPSRAQPKEIDRYGKCLSRNKSWPRYRHAVHSRTY